MGFSLYNDQCHPHQQQQQCGIVMASIMAALIPHTVGQMATRKTMVSNLDASVRFTFNVPQFHSISALIRKKNYKFVNCFCVLQTQVPWPKLEHASYIYTKPEHPTSCYSHEFTNAVEHHLSNPFMSAGVWQMHSHFLCARWWDLITCVVKVRANSVRHRTVLEWQTRCWCLSLMTSTGDSDRMRDRAVMSVSALPVVLSPSCV